MRRAHGRMLAGTPSPVTKSIPRFRGRGMKGLWTAKAQLSPLSVLIVEATADIAHHRPERFGQLLGWILALRAWPEIGHDVLQAAKHFLGVALTREEMFDLSILGDKLLH